MTTIGFRFEDTCQSGTQPKRSLLQRMNESHGSFISSMRLNKGEKHANRRQKYIEESRSRALSASSSLTQVSISPSDGSSASVERDQPELGSRNSSFQDDSVQSPSEIVSGCESDFSVPFQYATMPKDREQRRNIVNGMQNFMVWKQASYDSSLERPFHISPPQTPQSSHSWSSMCSAPSEMSDEQLDQWLEQPEDAEEHRFRKASEAGATAIPMAKPSTAFSEQAGSEQTSDGALASSWGPKTLASVEKCFGMNFTTTSKRKPIPQMSAFVAPSSNSTAVDCSKPLPLPNELLQEIAFQPHTSGVQPFRFSRDLMGDFSAPKSPT